MLTYSGLIDGSPITLIRSSDTSLTFIVPILSNGIHTLTININGRPSETTFTYLSPTAGSNSENPVRLKINSADTLLPSLAVAESGNAIAVWSEGSYPSYSLWFNTYDPNSGWGTAQSIGTGVGSEYYAKVAVNSSGLAVLVWIREINGSREILASNYDHGKGWSAASVLDSSGLGMELDVTLDDNGNANAIWNRKDTANSQYSAMTARYASNKWGLAQILQTNVSIPVIQLSSNYSGMSAATFCETELSQSDPSQVTSIYKLNTYVSLYAPDIGWSSSLPVGNEILVQGGGYIYGNPWTPGQYNVSDHRVLMGVSNPSKVWLVPFEIAANRLDQDREGSFGT